MSDDRDYFRHRADEERERAEESSCVVRSVHHEMAELYDALAEAKAPLSPVIATDQA